MEECVWAVCRRQAITGCLCLCVCLCPYLSGDRVEQRHGNSLIRLLESCYQVPDLAEISFLHTRSGLKHKKKEGGKREFSVSIISISTSKPTGEMKRPGQGRLEMSSCRFTFTEDIRCAQSRDSRAVQRVGAQANYFFMSV